MSGVPLWVPEVCMAVVIPGMSSPSGEMVYQMFLHLDIGPSQTSPLFLYTN